MGAKKRKPTPGSEPPAAELPELPERWSAGRKTELVLRLLRGEALDAVSRESQVPARELESWKRVLREQGTRGRGRPASWRAGRSCCAGSTVGGRSWQCPASIRRSRHDDHTCCACGRACPL